MTSYCYMDMFEGCTSLSEAPILSSTSLNNGCYMDMFRNCTNLSSTTELPATILSASCYSSMFNGCTRLTDVCELSVQKLASSCFQYMFSDCKSLKINENSEDGKKILSIPSDVQSQSSWNTNMFYNTAGTFKGNPQIGKTYRCYS